MAKVFTFSRKVFFIFNIFPSFDLSKTCVVVITWFCGYFLRRQFWLLLFVWYTLSVPHVVAVFIFFTHSDTISIMLLEFSPPFFFVHWSGRNVIWKAIEARSISRKKGWRKGEKIKKFGYILFSFPGMFLIKCLILFLSHLVTTVFFPPFLFTLHSKIVYHENNKIASSLPLPNSLICVARSFQKDELLVMKTASTHPFSPMFAGLDISKRNHKVSFTNSGQGKRSIRKRDLNNLLLIRLTFTLLCFLHLECTSLLKVSCIVDPILTQFNTKLLHSLAISFLVVGIVRS